MCLNFHNTNDLESRGYQRLQCRSWKMRVWIVLPGESTGNHDTLEPKGFLQIFPQTHPGSVLYLLDVRRTL